MTQPAPKRSDLLDAVRGVAVLMVVAGHYAQSIAHPDTPAVVVHAISLAWTGVDLFFVLSGFLIGGILIDNRASPVLFTTFYARRALRILPLYVGLLALHWVSTHDGMLIYLTFTQNFAFAAQAGFGPHDVAPTWSLAVEEQFYLTLPLLVWLLRPPLLFRVTAGLAIAAPLFRLAVLAATGGNTYAAFLLLPGRMDALFLGVLLACIVRDPRALVTWANRKRHLDVAILGLGGLCIASVWIPFAARELIMTSVGLSVVALLYAALLLRLGMAYADRPLPAVCRPLIWCGIGAYSLYLFHQPAFFGVRPYLGRGIETAIVAFLGVTMVAFLTWHLIEKPCMQFGKRLRYSGWRRAPGAAAPEAS